MFGVAPFYVTHHCPFSVVICLHFSWNESTWHKALAWSLLFESHSHKTSFQPQWIALAWLQSFGYGARVRCWFALIGANTPVDLCFRWMAPWPDTMRCRGSFWNRSRGLVSVSWNTHTESLPCSTVLKLSPPPIWIGYVCIHSSKSLSIFNNFDILSKTLTMERQSSEMRFDKVSSQLEPSLDGKQWLKACRSHYVCTQNWKHATEVNVHSFVIFLDVGEYPHLVAQFKMLEVFRRFKMNRAAHRRVRIDSSAAAASAELSIRVTLGDSFLQAMKVPHRLHL